MSLPFVCPECRNSWQLSKKEYDTISKHLPLECRNCGNRFDIIDGITENITSDNLFLQYALRSNHVLSGYAEVIPGHFTGVDLKDRFSEIHKVFLTPTGPIYCEPVVRSNSRFLILSSKYKERTYSEKSIQVMWAVYGNKRGIEAPPTWRQLLASAKGYEIEKNFRMEIVELESAFEVFLTEYLRPKLQEKFSDRYVELVFKRFNRMEDVTNLLFGMATGNTLREILHKANRDRLYGIWKKDVKDQRDKILHKGEKVKKEIAKKGFEAVFKIIVFLEPRSLEYLYTSYAMHESTRGNVKG